MPLGVCYYPEHWPQTWWADDAKQMQALGLEYVRIGEFAWALMEPAAGQYDWAWLDQAIETLASQGLKIVLGTPTATPPAWLTHTQPDLMRIDAQGRRLGHGGRRQACLVNPAYIEYSRQIVTAMAERYGQHPAVAAWQIDNEIGNHGSARCYCDHCAAAFRQWLSQRYGDLAGLNEAWGTAFWSQTYSDWQQIPLPNVPVGGGHNPSLVLDYRRFASDQQVAYCAMQAEILRQHSPNRTILTNIAPGDDEINWFDMAQQVDTIAWDNYPHGFPDWQAVAMYHDHIRGLKRQPFWVMEQQPGQINWTPTNPPVPPNQVRLWSYQDAAHGAANVLYFRWRACWLGQEQYHSGLRDHANRPARGSSEARIVANEWQQHGQPEAAPRKVALLVSYDDHWAQQLDPHAQGWNYWQLLRTIHRTLTSYGVGVDIVQRGTPLDGYQLAIAVAPMLDNPAETAGWREWVQAGGTLICTPRSLTKRRDNRTAPDGFPSGLTDVFGADVAEWSALDPAKPWAIQFGETSHTAPLWMEVLNVSHANTLATWSKSYAKGQAAITAATYGKGLAVLMGCYPTEEILGDLLPRLWPAAQRLPNEIERIELTDGVLWFNHGEQAQSIKLQGTWHDRLSGEQCSGECSIESLGIRWFTQA